MKVLKVQQLLVYIILAVSMLANSISTVFELHHTILFINSYDDFLVAGLSSLFLCLICLLFMNFASRRKIFRFYFKENSVDWTMRAISYVFIFYSFFISNLISIMYHLLETDEIRDLSNLSNNIVTLSEKTMVIFILTIMLMFSISIKTDKKNEV